MHKTFALDPFEKDIEDNFEKLREPKNMKKMIAEIKNTAAIHLQKKKL